MRRFPLRTLILMVLALIVFVRMWIVTHKPKEPEPGKAPDSTQGVQATGTPPSQAPAGASPASAADCKTLERSLEAVVRSPGDAQALAEAQRKLEACPEAPARACELGMALEVRSAPAQEASPSRELLRALCQRCPAEVNTCAELVGRALIGVAPGRPLSPEEVRWNLENAGPGTGPACVTLVRSALIPAATTGGKVNPAHPPLVTALAPICAKVGQLPATLVHAVVLQQGALAGDLRRLILDPAIANAPDAGVRLDGGTARDGGTAPDAGVAPIVPPIAPTQITGAEAGRLAFDGNEKSGVDLGNGVTPRWEADGALRAQFDPPLKQLTSVRFKAKGPGALRAIVRTPPGLGLEDKERGTYFVNPTLCQFKGTDQWATCSLLTPLVDVEAISVFPLEPKISLYEMEINGTR